MQRCFRELLQLLMAKNTWIKVKQVLKNKMLTNVEVLTMMLTQVLVLTMMLTRVFLLTLLLAQVHVF